MENIENSTIYLVETELKKTSVKVDIPKYIYGIEEIDDYFINLIGNKPVENFYVVYMNAGYETVAISLIAKGDISNVTLSIGEVLRIGLLANAKYFIMVHNHPSGIAEPSKADCEITKKMAQAAKLININLIDSIIVCENRKTFSMRKMILKP